MTNSQVVVSNVINLFNLNFDNFKKTFVFIFHEKRRLESLELLKELFLLWNQNEKKVYLLSSKMGATVSNYTWKDEREKYFLN